VQSPPSTTSHFIQSVPSQISNRSKITSKWIKSLSDSSSDEEDECAAPVKTRLDNNSPSKRVATKRSVFALDGDQDFGLVSNQIKKAKSPSSSPNSSAECDVYQESDLLALEEVESADHSSDSSSDDDEDIDALT